MFPFILLFFLLQIHLFSAEEFPLLMNRIQVTWADTEIASQINAKPTWSTDGHVPNFIFCGPFKSSGKDGICDYIYNAQFLTSNNTMKTINGSGPATAKLISTINETYSCMSFDDPIENFAETYAQFAEGEGDYSIKYTCQVVPDNNSPDNTVAIICGLIVVAFLLVGVGVFAYKLGQKKSAESLQSGLIQ